jgi:hypothetical protein
MSDDGVLTFDFEECGVDLEGAEVGMFSGSASIDKDGIVVGLTLDAFIDDTSRQFGPLKQTTRHLKVPMQRNQLTSLSDLIARALADTIEKRFKRHIEDELNEWCVSLAEREWEYPEAAE